MIYKLLSNPWTTVIQGIKVVSKAPCQVVQVDYLPWDTAQLVTMYPTVMTRRIQCEVI